ncbi:hypothetical protein FRC01_013172 [Tulasnella sp. 417]|nr:hypothetical protein FRC01_013172 [Tulasnella sp. 417]
MSTQQTNASLTPIATTPTANPDVNEPMDGTTGQQTVPIDPPKTPTKNGSGSGQGGTGKSPPSLSRQGIKTTPFRIPSLISAFGQNLTLTNLDKVPLEEAIKLLMKEKIQAAQEERTLLVSFPVYSAPRCMKTGTLWKEMLSDPEVAAGVVTERILGKSFVWVSVYKTTRITESEVNLFKEGLAEAQLAEMIPDLDVADYTFQGPQGPKACSAFLVATANEDAMKRILLKRVWTIRSKGKDATFFIQRDDSWATHIILNIHSGGADFLKDVLPRLYRTMGSAFATKTSVKPCSVTFDGMAYHRVTQNEHMHKGAKGIVWRIKFKPSSHAMKTTWRYPYRTGLGNRGMLEIKQPPFCPHCVSYSHQQAMCQWWRDPLVAGSNTRPNHQIDVEWIPIETVSFKKLGVEGASGPA